MEAVAQHFSHADAALTFMHHKTDDNGATPQWIAFKLTSAITSATQRSGPTFAFEIKKKRLAAPSAAAIEELLPGVKTEDDVLHRPSLDTFGGTLAVDEAEHLFSLLTARYLASASRLTLWLPGLWSR